VPGSINAILFNPTYWFIIEYSSGKGIGFHGFGETGKQDLSFSGGQTVTFSLIA
jgi:hypothetical protein